MIRIAVCDDNGSILNNIANIVTEAFEKYTDDFSVEKFLDGTLLIDDYNKEPFDIIFLDIDMPQIGGFDVAKSLRDSFSKCFIIFITNHSDLVYKSLDFQPFHFIQKNSCEPLKSSIPATVKKLMVHMKQNEAVIFENKQTKKQVVFIRDIIYLESTGHYINYYTKTNSSPIKIRELIKDCEEKYSNYNFVRIHKGILLNLRYLSYFDNSTEMAVLNTGDIKLPVGKKYKEAADRKYTIYLRETI